MPTRGCAFCSKLFWASTPVLPVSQVLCASCRSAAECVTDNDRGPNKSGESVPGLGRAPDGGEALHGHSPS
jgi:hypothetical protein